MAVAAQLNMNSIRSHVAALGVPLRKQLEKAESTWGVRAWQVAAFAATLIPLIGLGATYFLDRQKNSLVATNKKNVLAKHYRSQVAAVTGVRPDKVGAKELDLAKGNAAIAQAVNQVEDEQKSADRASLFALGGASALSWAIPLPGMGPVAHTAAKLAVDVTGAIGGSVVSGFFDKDVLQAHDVILHLNEKQAAGQAITAEDMVTLKISLNEPLQQQLKKANGKAFHKMSAEQQRAVMMDMPDIAEAEALANQVNTTSKTVEDVLMGFSNKQGWMARVGAGRAPAANEGSYVARLNAQRAAAMAAGERQA